MRRNLPLLAVFLTGAAVLVVEVAATRILAPYYGNTIYTFSSVIGIILAALSCGYYLGGKLADRTASHRQFFALIAAGGLSVLLLQLLNAVLVPHVGYRLGIMAGPLVLSILLFALPVLLLGTLSPYAIKLLQVARPGEGVGSISGKVFFWSTIGSILGTLAAGFFLVPHFGVGWIMVGTGGLLVLLGCAGMACGNLINAVSFFVVGVVLAIGASTLLANVHEPGVHVDEDGVYEHLLVFDTDLQGRPARVLKQDRAVSGILYLDNNEVTDYLNYATIATLIKRHIQSTLVIGGGAYLLPKLLLERFPAATVDVAEIEPGLFHIARQYFQLPASDPRLLNHLEDGRRFLHDSEKKYDLIFSDVFYALTVPPHFATREFFELAKSRLSDNGVFMANFVGDFRPEVPSILLTEIRTMQSVFEDNCVFAVDAPESMEVQGVIAIGVNGSAKLDMQSAEIANSPDPLIRKLPEHLVSTEKLSALAHQRVLTDDYCPTEYIALKTHRRELTQK